MLSLAAAWVGEQEQTALRNGIPLDAAQVCDARAAGVSNTEQIRVLKVPQVPIPEHPVLRAVCDTTKAISSVTWALSARYGILVRADRWGQREVVVHEMVHTSQYEKLGGIQAFLRQYLEECLMVGFPHGAMEQQAINTAAKICAPAAASAS